ncbi:MAG: carbohydrate ABC transporter permease, partial [Spirochaetes bacterium]|nr:carbohydrate ABC transporter permease [Spirochaetota bacterium]
SFVMLIPLYWLVKTSLTGENIYIYPPSLIPKNPNLYNFVDVYYWIPFARYFLNSTIVSVIVVISNIIFNSMAGFALCRSFPGKKAIILVYLGSIMIPFQTTIIPAFLITKRLGLLNTHLGMALPLFSIIICIFVFKNSFEAIPSSLIDSARIDGLPDWKMIYKITLPLSKPAIATNVILSFLYSWNSFLWPLIIIRDRNMQTLPLGLSRFFSYFEQSSGQIYAFSILVVAPVILVFLLSQKSFIGSMLSGAVKG